MCALVQFPSFSRNDLFILRANCVTCGPADVSRYCSREVTFPNDVLKLEQMLGVLREVTLQMASMKQLSG